MDMDLALVQYVRKPIERVILYGRSDWQKADSPHSLLLVLVVIHNRSGPLV